MKILAEMDILKLVGKDSHEAEKALAALSAPDQARVFLAATDMERIKVLELSRDPRAMLENVPPTEVWYTVKRLTPNDALPLIKYSTPEQLQLMADIEWWKKDRLDDAIQYEWLDYILACGFDKMMEWFKEGDWDQIEWFFKQNVVAFKKVIKDEDPADSVIWPRDASPVTFDGVTYFQVINQDREEIVTRYLEILIKHDFDLYNTLLEACIWDLPSNIEEDAYEVRTRRLAEEGFPSFEESLSVYSPLKISRFNAIKDRPKEFVRNENIVPRYPLLALGDRVLFINMVFKELSTETQDRFLLETSTIANKLLIADGNEISEESLSEALKKSLGYINIGLEMLSDGSLEKVIPIVDSHYIQSIFQVGWGEVLEAKTTAMTVFKGSWINGRVESLLCLEERERVTFENLLKKRPLYFSGESELSNDAIRDFASISDTAKAREIISRSEFLGRFVKKLFLNDSSLDDFVDNPDDLRFTGVAATVLVHGVVSGEWRFKPVARADLSDFIKKMKIYENGEKLEKAVLTFKEWIIQEMNIPGREVLYLDKFLSSVTMRVADEFSAVEEALNPKFISCVWSI